MRITLATLHTATAQQVFDQVRDHMLRQGQKSTVNGNPGAMCAYRGAGGLMCAAGCLISDGEYRPSFEGNTWASGMFPDDHYKLIRRMQLVHDSSAPAQWEVELRSLAEDFGLAWTITLATLPTASAQEVFEHVVTHLLKQNERCMDGTNCAYRGEAGACAAGSLMSNNDAERLADFNVGYGWSYLINQGLVPSEHSWLVMELQRIHDMWGTHEWPEALRNLAARNDLDAAFMTILEPVSNRETTIA